jgi:hypothetical protein
VPSVNYEEVYLRAYDSVSEGRALDRLLPGLLQQPKTAFEP